MRYLLILLFVILYSYHSGSSKKEKDEGADSIFPETEMFTMENNCDTVVKEKQQALESENPVLNSIPRDIPLGEAINPDSLSMRVEYDYYPLSTTEVKVIITNHSRYEYDCGEGYSLVYYNEKQKTWETLPTNPIRNDVLWIFPLNCPTHEQTIRLYTSEVPNHPGKYRIYKSFNGNTKVAYAGFKMVDKKGIEQIRKRISEYNMKNRDTIAQNITDFGSYGDTIEVSLINIPPIFRKCSDVKWSVIRQSVMEKISNRSFLPHLHILILYKYP